MSKYKDLDLEDRMPFGKYKDKKIKYLFQDDPLYGGWLISKSVGFTKEAKAHLAKSMMAQRSKNIQSMKKNNYYGGGLSREDDSLMASCYDLNG